MMTIPVQRPGAIASGDCLEHLLAPPPADSTSRQSEVFAERAAPCDFALKAQVETMRRVGLAMVGAESK